MRVLIVDDDSAITESIKDRVNWKKLGVDTAETACSAEQAKTILKKESVDVVISDIEMPKESGLELLKWYREQKLDGKFLLLTCHENFHYATEAIKYHAEEYLLKPFNVDIMEMALQKILSDLRKEKEEKLKSRYGQWVIKNRRELRLTFWENVLSGRIASSERDIERENKERNLGLEPKDSYRLIVSRVTNMEHDIDTYGRSLIQFILENLHSELIFGSPENDSIVYFEYRDYYCFAAVCKGSEEELKEKCSKLIKKCGSLLFSTVSCCVSNPCKISDFYDKYHSLARMLSENVIYYGNVFMENQVLESDGKRIPILDMKKLKDLLNSKEKKGFLDYLKQELDKKVRSKALGGETLKTVNLEVQQAVYAHLAEEGIQISLILDDTEANKLSEKSEQSVIDLMRWENYLLNKVFSYEEEIQKSQSIIEKINHYIQENYKENIGRNEIGAHFFLVPEYLAKMYKKKTGITLKDYINSYRLNQAKIMLSQSDIRVSEIASEVGFDNFSYFSTLFKKEYGISPNEYRKRNN